jgi:hypothetical protein
MALAIPEAFGEAAAARQQVITQQWLDESQSSCSFHNQKSKIRYYSS